jgi:integral membrane protein
MTEQTTLPQTARNLERGQLKQLEIMSIIEATTLVTLVCIAVPLKHMFGWPLGVKILGPIHGLAFLAYVWTAVQTVAGGGWQRWEIVRLFVVAFIPFAGFFNIDWLRRRNAMLNDGQVK